MILSAQSIRRRCVEDYPPLIDPFVERDVVRGMSLGLSAASYDVRIAESMTINPGEFVLASTMERFDIPDDVLIVAHDKSSWARRGLAVQNTIFDPGWRGYAALELTNHGRSSLTILAGDPIAQIVCHLLTEPTEQPYSGKYQDQQRGPQSARRDRATLDEPPPARRTTSSPSQARRNRPQARLSKSLGNPRHRTSATYRAASEGCGVITTQAGAANRALNTTVRSR
jgi:dCTP deaminase